MPADSLARRLLKRLLFPLVNERTYQLAQAIAKAWDIRRGNWTEPELQLIPFAVDSGESVLDIGANYGLYTYHLSRAVTPSGKVYAFEPIPFTYETCQLVGKLLRFKQTEIFPKGCSDHTGRVAFTLPVQRSGSISAGQVHIAGRNDERNGKDIYSPFDRTLEMWCDVVAVDEFLPELSNLSLIKSDIEGADLLALRGASRTIERNHPTVICEIKNWFLDGFGIRPDEFGEFFFNKGYGMFHYDILGGHGILQPVTLGALGMCGSDNYVFVHESRRDRFAPLLKNGASGRVFVTVSSQSS